MEDKLEYPLWDTSPISSDYGWRTLEGKADFHYGIDFAPPLGSQILGIGKGTVLAVGYDSARGNYIEYYIDDLFIGGQNFCVCNYHMMDPSTLKVDDKVKTFQVIGVIGATGNATGPHLHFEIRLHYPGAGWQARERRPDPKQYIYMTSKKDRPDPLPPIDPCFEIKKENVQLTAEVAKLQKKLSDIQAVISA